MDKLYKISCECGRDHQVSLAQSGTSLECPCGRVLQVPSFRELSARQPTSDAELSISHGQLKPPTNWVSAFEWIGVILLGIAAIGAFFLYLSQPRLPNLHRVPPAVAYHYLKVLKTGVDGYKPPAESQYIQYERIWHGLWDLVSLLAVVGALLVVGIKLAEWWEQRSQRQLLEEEEAAEEIAAPKTP